MALQLNLPILSSLFNQTSHFFPNSPRRCTSRTRRLSCFHLEKRHLGMLGLGRHVKREPKNTVACAKADGFDLVSTVNLKAPKVSAVIFDMDGVLCNSEEPSRQAAVDLFKEMGVEVSTEDFVPFMGTGEANFLGGVASLKGLQNFDPQTAKKRFFEIYLAKYAQPNSGIGFPGALELIMQCKQNGLKVAVASSADRIKVDANLAAAGLPQSIFDAVLPADLFENLKPAPDIFLAASRLIDVPPQECIVIEDALAGIEAAKAANMRCIALATTLSKEVLVEATPSLIKDAIGDVLLEEILGDALLG